ncbi:hypothetical protein F5Y15DRAFT_365675 [Xylariaceae sp. FL0016]|nr:hypothetical protein F5Y15DRAFT_365675 [Xylariaceae sp. FL0016]
MSWTCTTALDNPHIHRFHSHAVYSSASSTIVHDRSLVSGIDNKTMDVAILPTHNQLRCLAPSLSPPKARQGQYKLSQGDHTAGLTHHRVSQRKLNSCINHSSRVRKAYTPRQRCALEREDDLGLAEDHTVSLPSDNSRNKPRLQRQEAFQVPQAWNHTDHVDDDADLYRLGILYDDEYSRGSGFGIDLLDSVEPVYSIRPAKRARKSREAQFEADEDSCLFLDLSFASLRADLDIAQYLTPDIDEITTVNVEQVAKDRAHGGEGRSVPMAPPLSVIHEDAESSIHSLSRAQETSDVPDLISDCKEGEEESNFCDEWALLEMETSSTIGADIEDGPGAHVDAEPSSIGAWVILGDGL